MASSANDVIAKMLDVFKTQLTQERELTARQFGAQTSAIADIQCKLGEVIDTVQALASARSSGTSLSNADATVGDTTMSEVNVNTLIATLSKRIDKFVFDPHNNLTFNKWYSRYKSVITVDGQSLDDKVKVRLLLEKLDSTEYEQYINQIMPEVAEDQSLDDTVKVLTEMFDEKKSLFTARYQCLRITKLGSESYLEYTGRVNKMCEQAELSKMTANDWKSLLWISGMDSSHDNDIRLRLLSFLDKAKDDNRSVKIHDLYNEYSKVATIKRDAKMVEKRAVDVSEVKSRQNFVPRSRSKTPLRELICFNCGLKGHVSPSCRNSKSKCSKCEKFGHLSQHCRSGVHHKASVRGRARSPYRNTNTNSVTAEVSNALVETNVVRKYITVPVNDVGILFQLDTASDVTLITEDDWKALGKPHLKETNIAVKVANNQRMKILGTIQCKFELKGKIYEGDAYVNTQKTLLGLEWLNKSQEMQDLLDEMVSVCNVEAATSVAEQLKKDFPSVFEEGLGYCNKEKAKLELKEGAKPVFCQARRTAFSAKEAVKSELNRLLEMGVIEPVTHSQWAAPIVVVKKKNGKLRVCADFSTGLNDALLDNLYPLPLMEDIFGTLNGGRYFAQIDLSDAYLQMELDDESKKLMVINTEEGLFRYNRLTFGVKVAPAIFQNLMNKMVSGIPGCIAYLDDIILMGKTKEELKDNLWKVFERIKDYGMRVRLEKCNFMKEEVNYLGFIIDRNGRRPDPEKVKPFAEMPAPKNVKEVQSFLGSVTHYGQFIKELKKMRGPLDALVKKDAQFKWTAKEQKAFEDLRNVLSSDLNLVHYDPEKEIIIAADACEYGIGGVISHRMPDGTEKPIAHMAKALTPAEKNYAQIEKEGLALIRAITKFHKYVYGRKFILRTDHKPLLAIFGSKKGIPVYTANRLSRWATILLGYNFEIEYVKTDDFGQADALSRLIYNSPPPQDDEEVVIASVENEINGTVEEIIRNLPVTAKDIKEETRKDKVLMRVFEMISSGKWPDEKKLDKESKEFKVFLARKSRLTSVNGLIIDCERVVIPKTLRFKILAELHNGHFGTEKMRKLARSYVYWPLIDKDIEDFVSKCRFCVMNQKSPTKVPLAPWPKPTAVWERIHIDFAGPIDGKYLFVVVDALSKWPEVEIMTKITGYHTVIVLENLFSRFGYPKVIVSDNGPQFTGADFAEMCAQYGIEHIRSPAYHPQSNGQAERFVDTIKRGLKKLKGEGKATEKSLKTLLMAYRTAPCSAIEDKTPAEIFLGRTLRTRLSLVKDDADNRQVSPQGERMKKQFDAKHGVKARDFIEGGAVLCKKFQNNNWIWAEGIIIKPIGNVLYLVQTNDGKISRFHRNQLRKSCLVPNAPSDDSSDIWLNEMLDTFNLRDNVSGTETDENAGTGTPTPAPSAHSPFFDTPSNQVVGVSTGSPAFRTQKNQWQPKPRNDATTGGPE